MSHLVLGAGNHQKKKGVDLIIIDNVVIIIGYVGGCGDWQVTPGMILRLFGVYGLHYAHNKTHELRGGMLIRTYDEHKNLHTP